MIPLDKYAYIGELKRVHPAEKVCFMLSFLLFVLVSKSFIIACITFLVMSYCIVCKAKVTVGLYLRLLALPLIFLLTSVLTIIVSFTAQENVIETPLWLYDIGDWKMYITSSSLSRGIIVSCTAIASVSCMYFLILTTSIHELVWIFQKIKLPTLLIELILFTYRFIFVLLDKGTEIFVAQSSRLGYSNKKVWLVSIGQLIVSIFIKSTRTAYDFHYALASRGGEETLNLCVDIDQTYNKVHWMIISGCILVLLVVIVVT